MRGPGVFEAIMNRMTALIRRIRDRLQWRWINVRSEVYRRLLIREIQRAFADSVYPGDEAIGREEVSMLRGDWRLLPLPALQHGLGELLMFCPRGRAYYIPAILIHCLSGKAYDPTDLVYFLSPHSSVPDYDGQVRWTDEEIEWKEKILNEFASVLSIQQARVIARFCKQFDTILYPWECLSGIPVELDFPELHRAQAFWTAKLEEKLRDNRTPAD